MVFLFFSMNSIFDIFSKMSKQGGTYVYNKLGGKLSFKFFGTFHGKMDEYGNTLVDYNRKVKYKGTIGC